ncbi:DNA-directed DNA polymerase alpha catalytic subunit pol1 [Hypoxylon texense]
MTSSVAHQNQTSASNTSAAASAPSYASAAGASKKPSSTPVVATGSTPPVVAAGSLASTPHHAKSASITPLNGRPNIMPAIPAVPTVAHGTSNINGISDHTRKSSVTMSANGLNSYTTNGGPTGGKANIQFGFQDSPAVSHSSPQIGSAPIPIPESNPRVTSPQNSPSPIPQPSASGGRPPSGAAQQTMTFGSFGGDSERPHMRSTSVISQDPGLGAQHSPHIRRGSNVSDMSNQAGPPQMGRGNFPSAGRGRGFANNSYNQPMGYPPNNYGRGHQNPGRGGMPPNFGSSRQQQFGTPPPHNRSPALPPAMPQPPNMGAASMQPQFFYPPPAMGTQVPQVNLPHFYPFSHERAQLKVGKKRPNRREIEKFSNPHRRADSFNNEYQDFSQKSRRFSRRSDQKSVADGSRRRGSASLDKVQTSRVIEPPVIPLQQPFPVVPTYPQNSGRIDLSPESGAFDRLLTSTNPQSFYHGHFDPNMRPGMPVTAGYPMYPIMHGQGQSPVPAYQQPFNPGPYNPQGGQPMSRNSSQVSTDHRPASSTSQSQAPVVAQGTPQLQHAQTKPAVVSSPQFTRPPKKSAAITIKNAAGETVDFTNLRAPAPASPVPSIQQSKTPPVIASTPTPPPKSQTPKAAAPTHSRTESASNSKTAEEVRNEFKEKMKQAASADKAREEEAAKVAAEKAKEEERLKAEQKAQEEAKAAEEAKARQEAEEKEKAEREAAAAAAKKEEAPKPVQETDEEELERIIREMEEEDARREKEAAERQVKIDAEKAAKKKAEEESRLANAAENDRKLREAEAEMERLEEEKERRRAQGSTPSLQDLLKKPFDKQADKTDTPSASETTAKLASLSLSDKPSTPASIGAKSTSSGRNNKPAALNLAPINTKSVEPPQPSAALQSLKTARLLGSSSIKADLYPPGIYSPNPALNTAVAKKGTSFKYDPTFLLQFQKVFTEQPSVDFHQQVKTLIGDSDGGRSASARTPAGGSGRQNSRTNVTGPVGFGSFHVPPGGRTLPPGTTSAERFHMSEKSTSRPMVAPMTSFRGPFPGGNQMARTPSSSNMSMPHSPRQGSRRNASKQNTFSAKVEAQAAKTMPLTQGMRIEALSTSQSGWKPTSIGKGPSASAPTPNAHLDPQMVQRKVKAALNKMTPENFEKISDQILQIAAQSKDETDGRTLRQVIQLTFEKATDEAHWASMYAKFCKKMLETMSPEVRDENITDKNGQVVSGGALFRKYLLNRCQEEFERGWKLSLPKPEEGQDKSAREAAMLSEEYYIAAAAKRRGLGLVQFIGELYKLGMLTERIMHECVRKLVDYQGIPDEAEVESLSKLLRTIGANLDATDKGRVMMDAYFARIQSMVDLPELPSRLKFMLMDVLDLRKASWVSKEANKGPKTLEEVRAEAEAQAAQKAAEAARSSQRGGPGRPQVGRGDARNFSGYTQQNQNQVGMDDLRRLKGGASRTSSGNVTLGPMSMLGSRSNSGRRLGPGSSLSRGAEDSAASSRTGTPPVRDAQSSTNSFGLLANMDSDHPASPPSTAASPALAKVVPDTTAKAEKESS